MWCHCCQFQQAGISFSSRSQRAGNQEEPKFGVSIFWDHLFLFLSLLALSLHSHRVGLVKLPGNFVGFDNFLTFPFLTFGSKEGERWGCAIYWIVSPHLFLLPKWGSSACDPGGALVLLKQNVLLKAKVHLIHPLASLRNQPKMTVPRKGMDTCRKPATTPSTLYSSKTKSSIGNYWHQDDSSASLKQKCPELEVLLTSSSFGTFPEKKKKNCGLINGTSGFAKLTAWSLRNPAF